MNQPLVQNAKSQYLQSWSRIMAYVAIIIAAMYVLTPRFYEPGGESWIQWAAARILRETGELPFFSRGPFYVLYLQCFSFFDYPLSIQLEYFATHLFCSLSIFFMLKSRLPVIPALLLTCAWISILAPVEGGAMVAGIGFLALYCRRKKRRVIKEIYFSPSLGAAALCHPGYMPFFLGHFLGVLLQRYRSRQPLVTYPRSIDQVRIPSLIISMVLVLLMILTTLYQSDRMDHNHMAMDPTYSPVSLENPMVVGFFQAGNWKHVMRNVPQSEWIYQDWYFTNQKVFGGATTILEAIFNSPKVFVTNILENLVPFFQLPAYFFMGNLTNLNGFSGLLWFMALVSLFGLVRSIRINGLTPRFLSLTLGTTALIASLFLTSFNPRYVIGLLPVGLLMISFASLNLPSMAQILWTSKSDPLHPRILKSGSHGSRIFFVVGFIFILSGVFLNEWILTAVFSSDGVISPSTRLNIRMLDILLVTCGVLFIIKRDPLAAMIKEGNPFHKPTSPWFTKAIIITSAAFVLWSAHYPHGREAQIKAVLKLQGLLSPAKNTSMLSTHQELQATVNEQTSVLALEDIWIKAYTRADLDKTYDVFRLPPFEDSSGEVEKMLESLDVIWVSDRWAGGNASMGTQYYLRYLLHVEPFITKALERDWKVQEIKGYGKVYRRMISAS